MQKPPYYTLVTDALKATKTQKSIVVQKIEDEKIQGVNWGTLSLTGSVALAVVAATIAPAGLAMWSAISWCGDVIWRRRSIYPEHIL